MCEELVIEYREQSGKVVWPRPCSRERLLLHVSSAVHRLCTNSGYTPHTVTIERNVTYIGVFP